LTTNENLLGWVFNSNAEENTMKVTLRKAAQIRKAVEAAMNALRINPNVEIVIGSNVVETVAAAQKAAKETIEKGRRLNDVLSTLRLFISRANKENGIDDLVTARVAMTRQVALWNQIASIKPVVAEQITTRVDNLAKRHGQPGYYEGDSLTTGYLTAADIDRAVKEKATGQREIRRIDDLLAEYNANSFIEIDEPTYKFLEDANIV